MLDQMHIDRLDGIGRATPNLMFDTGTSFSGGTPPRRYIRGIGQMTSRSIPNQAVGIYLDGVYIGTSIGSVLDLTKSNGSSAARSQEPVRAQHHRWRSTSPA
jgi:iron complex outermembrane receptor protein